MDEERYLILKMLEEGKISAEEASALLEALDTGSKSGQEDDDPSEEDPHTSTHRRRRSRPRREGRHGSPSWSYSFDRDDFDEGMEEMRRQLEKVRLGAIDIGDEVSRQVRRAMDSCRDEWRRSGRRPFGHFVRDIGDIFSVPAGREMHEEAFEKEVEAEPGDLVRIKGLSGDMTVTSWDRDLVRVEARKRVWASTTREAEERAADYRIEVEREGNEIFIGARLGDEAPGWLPARCSIDYRVMVPAGSFVATSVTNGDVKVTGVRHGVELRSTNGQVTGERLAGPVSVNTTNGDISLKDLEAKEFTVRSVNGDIRLGLSAPAGGENTVHAVRGDVRLAVPADLRLDLRASTMHGDIRFGLPGSISSRTATRLAVRLGDTEGAGAGKTSGQGEDKVVPGQGEGEAVPGQGEDPAVPTVEVKTLFGDISIERTREE